MSDLISSKKGLQLQVIYRKKDLVWWNPFTWTIEILYEGTDFEMAKTILLKNSSNPN